MLRFMLLAICCSCLATGKDQRVTIKNYPDVYTVSADDSVFNYDELHRVALMSPLTGFDTSTEPFLAATGTHIDKRTGKVVHDKVMLAPLLESCEHGKPNCPPTRVDDAFLQNARTNLDQGRQQIRLLQEMPLPKILEPVRSFFLDNLETTFRMQQARQFDAAIGTAQRFLATDPDSIPGKLALANIYFMAQRLEDARKQTEQILAVDQLQPAALKLHANISYLLDDFGRAENTFIRLLDKYPNDEEGAYMLGRIYYQEGRVPQAMGQFERVIRINPKAYKAYDNLGLCYQALGDEKKATHAFLTAIKLVETEQPEYDWPYANLASLLLDSGDAKAAFALASKAADRNPLSARNFYIGGKALWQLNKTDLCHNWLQRSVALDPNYPEPLYILARVYQKIGRDDKAQEARDKFRELKAKQPEKRH